MPHLPHLNLKGESLKIILIVLLGWSCFSFADASTKHLTEEFPPAFLLTFSGLFNSILLFVWILYKKGWKGFLSPNWKWLVARGICIAITATCVVNALALIPLADLYGITFTSPFLILILAYTLLKENVGWHRWLAVSIGFAGVFILIGPQFNTFNIGIIYALISTISISLGAIIIRKVGKSEYLPLFVLYPSLSMLIVNAPLAIEGITLPPFPVLLEFIANTSFVLIGQLLVTYAFTHAKETAGITPFVYVQIVWGVLFGYFIFGDIPTRATITGLILIIGAGLYMIYRERQLAKKHNIL